VAHADHAGHAEHAAGPLSEFIEACAQRTPTPGGGSASALIGCVGAALGAMAARFSESGEATATKLDELRATLVQVIDEDCRAYGRLAESFRLPKDTDERKVTRREAVQDGLREAMRVPLLGARTCVEALESVASLAPEVNRHLASDAAISAASLFVAFDGLVLNVRVNARSIDDEAVKNSVSRELEELRGRAVAARDATSKAVESHLS